ncbi:hypothetical protein SDC9_200080 [bioreactor metagenome]|uniref:Uncharacterized protein n=1 Tax=bioreactor metagenome TaxID=1076179 RepID=A0A645IPS9_9ZZZZ
MHVEGAAALVRVFCRHAVGKIVDAPGAEADQPVVVDRDLTTGVDDVGFDFDVGIGLAQGHHKP